MKIKHAHILILFFLSVIFTAPHFLTVLKGGDATAPENVSSNTIDKSAFLYTDIEAKAAFVYEVNSGKVLYSKGEELQFPLASITKVMTALVAIENTTSDTLIKIEDESLAQEGDSGLLAGETWKLKDLIDLTLVSSSNDGANAIASAGVSFDRDSFMQKMNNKARELELTQTFFLNESGLDVNESFAGSYGSAKDIASLFSYVLNKHPNLLDATAYKSLDVNSLPKDYIPKIKIKQSFTLKEGMTKKISSGFDIYFYSSRKNTKMQSFFKIL